MIRRKLTYLAGGALAAIALISLMGPTSGGFPSRPRFQAVGIGTSAPANVGGLSALGNVNANLDQGVDNDSNGTANQARFVASSGDSSGAFVVVGSGFSGALVTNGPTGAQAVLRGLGSIPLVLGTNNTERVRIAGDGSSINLTATTVQANGSTIWTAANDGAGSGLDADLLDGISSASFLQAAFGTGQASAQRATITCSAGGNCDVTGIASGQSAIATKEADESRISTITETADSDLRFVNVPIGVYQTRTFIVTDNTTSTGVKVSLEHPTQVQDIDGIGTNNCNSALTHSIVQSAAAGPQQFLLCTATNDEGTARWEFALETSAIGTIGIVWAQQTSSATATQMRRRSSIELTRIN